MISVAKKKKKKSIFPKLILIVFVVYATVTIISNQVKVNRFNEDTQKNDELIVTESMRKAQIEQELRAEINDDYVTKEAQSQGYASPNERVFVDVAGS